MKTQSLTAATADEVWEALAGEVVPGKTKQLPVDETLGCVVAADVRCTIDFPPFDRSVMDGYAVRSEDFSTTPTTLVDRGLVRAGDAHPPSVQAGQCARINTGAPMPPGADAVIMVEKSRTLGNDRVELSEVPKPGQLIEKRAGLMKQDDLLLRGGSRIRPGGLAALVSGGVGQVTVFARPCTALLSTGDEVVSGGRKLQSGQIYDSNSVLLEELIRRAGADIVRVGRCPDDPAALRASLELGLAGDVLCVVGGMSKGTHDFVPGILEELGVEWLVNGLNLKPGRPTRIGRAKNGCWVLGLPGNPVSCTACFLLFGVPILQGLQGLGVRKPPHLSGMLDVEMPASSSRPLYQPATWSVDASGDVHTSPLTWRGSGDPFGMALANALIYRAADSPAAPRGEHVRFVPLEPPE